MAYDFNFVLKGQMPLIMNADNIDGGDALKEWQLDPENAEFSVKGDDRTPPWTWQMRVYNDGHFITMPSELIMAALREAGRKKVLKGNLRYTKATQGGIIIYGEHLEFLNNGNKVPIERIDFWKSLAQNDRKSTYMDQVRLAKELGFILFAKRAKPAGRGSGRHVRVRPRFDHWVVRGRGQVATDFEDILTKDIMRQIWHIAGHQSGLGDWRPNSPNSPGQFGMFEADLSFSG